MKADIPEVSKEVVMNAAQVLAIAIIHLEKDYFEILLQDFTDRSGQNLGHYLVTVKKL